MRPPGRPRRWPDVSLVVHTVAQAREGEPLRFGLWELAHCDAAWMGSRRGVFYADDLVAAEVEELRALCLEHGLPEPETRKQFVNRTLYRLAYKRELPLAGWFLPTDLGRLAVDWSKAANGGISLTLWTLPKPPHRKKASTRRRPILANGEVENSFRPRITVRMLDAQRPQISFTKTADPDRADLRPEGADGIVDPRYRKPGRFHVLSMHASSLAGKPLHTLAEACTAFGVAAPTAAAGTDLASAFAAALAELAATVELNRRLLDEHDRVADGLLAADRVYSSAPYGRAVLDAAGREAPLARNPTFPRAALAAGMGAYFGGECAVSIRTTREPLPCLFLDYTSVYPVVAALQQADRVLKADRLEVVEEDPAEVAAWLETITDADLLDPDFHAELALRFVELAPAGEPLPHRVPADKHWKTQVSELTSRQPLWFALADVLRARLQGGRPVRIGRVFRVVAHGRQRGLRPVRLPSGRVVTAGEDLLFALAQERLEGGSWQGAKACANACCSGLFAQVNVSEAPGKKTRQHVWFADGRDHIEHGIELEEPGRWYFPPLAASITAGGRLLQYFATRAVEQAGGTVAYVDTDSLAVIATPDGGLVPCPGGGERDEDGHECVRALSFSEADAIRDIVEPLNPYRRLAGNRAPRLLKIETDNRDENGKLVQAYLHARSTKNYDRYQLPAGGDPATAAITKASEHGLGHLHAHWPRSDGWIEEGREYLLQVDLGLQRQSPDWFGETAISLLRVNSWRELQSLGLPRSRRRRGKGVRPFSRIAVAHTDPLHRDEDGQRVTPVTPWHNGLTPETARWRNLRDGRPLRIRPTGRLQRESDLSAGGPVPVQTLRDVFNRLARRHDHGRDARGHPLGPHTSGLITLASTEAITTVAIGRETNDSDRVGITTDPAYRLYSDPDRDVWHNARDVLRILAPGLLRPGRPREADKPHLIRQAGEFARAELTKTTEADLPPDPVILCHVFLGTLGRLRVVCDGCGRRLGKREKRWCPICRSKRSLLARDSA